jgi:hypothetical protein
LMSRDMGLMSQFSVTSQKVMYHKLFCGNRKISEIRAI